MNQETKNPVTKNVPKPNIQTHPGLNGLTTIMIPDHHNSKNHVDLYVVKSN